VVSDDPAESSFAKVGVVFYLEDLKEVSGQTDDRIKYVVQHKVSFVYTRPAPSRGKTQGWRDVPTRPAGLRHTRGAPPAEHCKAQLDSHTTELWPFDPTWPPSFFAPKGRAARARDVSFQN